jgi:valyl-tRNA synthetase
MSGPGARVRAIDPTRLPKHFDSAEGEAKWGEAWETDGAYRWDPSRDRDETFVVDTPPPTASGSLHVGHIFSYVHTDIQTRHQRMLGQNIFYPMGWDDNGLPTERRVQNYYHVRCDPGEPYLKDLKLEPATAKTRKGRPQLVSRENFIELCHGLTAEDEKTFKALWLRAGISVDWQLEYATIDDHCRRVSPHSFLDLFGKNLVETRYAPTMWDPDFQTAVAQAEVEDRVERGAFHNIEFGVEGMDQGFVIATTRPELLAACVGVTAHPEDERYRDLFGKRAVTPLFRAPVPIFSSELADPEKGSGILMVCTFGDATDVFWWREHDLALRQLIGRNGRLQPLVFGGDGVESLDAEAANRFYAELEGKNVRQAQRRIVELLAEPEGSATGKGAPLQGEPEPIEHSVRFYERGERPLEYVPTRQWFVKLLEKKEALLAKGAEVQWHPAHMGVRYRDWTEGLQLDWCVSRQRYFGVPIPVWYPLDEAGDPDFENPIPAAPEQLPMDPMLEAPPGYDESRRAQPGGFVGEADVFDTWFTSSLTPQISSHWGVNAERHAQLFPADLRPQGPEIIRTWAFYTIAKAMLHEDRIPWKHAAISGWILDPDRKKMSKSLGNVETPMPWIERFGADACRYWAGSARLGVDTAFDEKVLKIGKRLVTKLFNAGKFVLSQEAEVHPVTHELDLAFVQELRTLAERTARSFAEFNFAQALQDTESFFWTRFTDTYLELSKARARGEAGADETARGSAVATLRLGLDVLLRLFAPALPYITEEVWSWTFADEKDQASIHRAPWPGAADFEGIATPANAQSLGLAVAAWTAINKAKADAEVASGREAESLTLVANATTLEAVKPVLADVLAAARVLDHTLCEAPVLEDGSFQVEDARFVERS